MNSTYRRREWGPAFPPDTIVMRRRVIGHLRNLERIHPVAYLVADWTKWKPEQRAFLGHASVVADHPRATVEGKHVVIWTTHAERDEVVAALKEGPA